MPPIYKCLKCHDTGILKFWTIGRGMIYNAHLPKERICICQKLKPEQGNKDEN